MSFTAFPPGVYRTETTRSGGYCTGLAFCGTLRHSAEVPNLRTANYPDHSRQRLAEAVAQARRAAGHTWRPSFATEAGVSRRSLEAVEAHEPTVGVDVLERIGRALGRHFRGWDAGTPRAILEGGDIPDLEPVRRGSVDIRWVAKAELTALLTRFRAEGYTADDLQEVLKQAEKEADL
jgi:hypothetical protein